MGVTGLRVDCVCVFVCTQNVYVHMCLYICVSYMRGRIRRGSEREDGASMRGWREFGLDSAGKGKSYRLSGGMLTGYPDMGFRKVSVSTQDRERRRGWGYWCQKACILFMRRRGSVRQTRMGAEVRERSWLGGKGPCC